MVVYSIQISTSISAHYGQDFLLGRGGGGGGGALKVNSEGIDCDGTFDLWKISEGCRKNWPFLWGEEGVLCRYL